MEVEEALALLDEAHGAQGVSWPSDMVELGADFSWGLLDDQVADVVAVETAVTATKLNGNQLTEKKKRKKINPNKARDERRFQLIELQDQVEELEFTIERLQTFKNKRPKTDNTNRRRTTEEDNGLPPVWQEICGRQITRRLEAERENVRLKQQYEREKKLVKSFKKLLYNRRVPRNAEPEATMHTRRTDIPQGYIEKMAAMVFKELEAGVEVCYGKVEMIFETQRVVPMNLVPHGSLLDRGVRTRGVERKFYDRRTMPFDMRAAGDAWWENWHKYRGQRFQDIAADEIVERFGLEMNDFKTNTSATAYAQQISQRHVEDDRIVVVWDAYVEPFGFDNERVGGVYFLEQNYVLIQPEHWSSERNGESKGRRSTRVSTCYAITPHFLDPRLKEDPKTIAVINFLVSALSTNIMALSEMVENLLLDQALLQCEIVQHV
ncbi:M96 mating-specific protein family [Phytophthora cinnamomi]|uniref:M96 mating-specific protein family n=1 Tax=Phytophthora cinnamomi TaxID=4785 RepID=UPI0035594BC4|nr:M96 mating-specific protein family [Phytophthora cinnamomi]